MAKLKVDKQLKSYDLQESKGNEITEAFTKQDVETLKLQYGFGLWTQFYLKCHELEDAFYITDNQLVKDMNEVSDKYITDKDSKESMKEKYNLHSKLRNSSNGDFASRDVKYDFEDYYQRNDWPKFDNEYFSERLKKMEKKYDRMKFLQKIFESQALRWVLAVVGLIAAMAISWNKLPSGFLGGFGIFLKAALIGIGVGAATFFGFWALFAILNAIICRNYKKFPSFASYSEKYRIDIRRENDYVEKEKDYHKECKERYNKDLSEVAENLPVLRQIKKELNKLVPLPPNYANENAVNGIFSLLINKRADTLKEAINLYENEVFHKSVIFNLDMFSNSLNSLRDQINDLTEIVTISVKANLKHHADLSDRLRNLTFKIN